MANTARMMLESALRARKLDGTLTTALPPLDRWDAAACLPTGLAALDACLGGGLPRGQLSEIVGARSSGRLTLLLQILAAATRRGEMAALVDTGDRLDVASVLAAGTEPSRVLWIRGHADAMGESRPGLERHLDRALKALNLVLQAGGFGVVAIDLSDVPSSALARLPQATWLRVQRVIEGSDTACLVLGSSLVARSAGGLTVSLDGRTDWAGMSNRSRRLDGMTVHARILSPRRQRQAEIEIVAKARSESGAE